MVFSDLLTHWKGFSSVQLSTWKKQEKGPKRSKYIKPSTQLKSRHHKFRFRITLDTRRQAVWLKHSIYGGQCYKWKTYSTDFLISIVCPHILEMLLLKLSLGNEDHVMEGLASSCKWLEFLCFRSSFMCLFMNPTVLLCSWASTAQRLQPVSAGLLSPVFTPNPELPQPLQLDLGHGRESGTAGLPTPHPHRSLAAGHPLRLLGSCPPRRAFFPIWLDAWRLQKRRHRSLG